MARHVKEPNERTLTISVDGDTDWPNSGAVAEALLRSWMDAGQPKQVTLLLTPGRTTGAEQMARTVAESQGWNTIDSPDSNGVPIDLHLEFSVQSELIHGSTHIYYSVEYR